MDIEGIRGEIDTGILTAESANYIELDSDREIKKSDIYIWRDFYDEIGARVIFQYA